MKHRQPLVCDRLEVQLVRDPRREADDALDVRRPCGRDRHGAAHREAEQHDALGVQLVDGRARVGDAGVEAAPRLHAVADLREREVWKPGRERAHEPLDGRAPRPFDLIGLAPVHADDGASGRLFRRRASRLRSRVGSRSRERYRRGLAHLGGGEVLFSARYDRRVTGDIPAHRCARPARRCVSLSSVVPGSATRTCSDRAEQASVFAASAAGGRAACACVKGRFSDALSYGFEWIADEPSFCNAPRTRSSTPAACGSSTRSTSTGSTSASGRRASRRRPPAARPTRARQ